MKNLTLSQLRNQAMRIGDFICTEFPPHLNSQSVIIRHSRIVQRGTIVREYLSPELLGAIITVQPFSVLWQNGNVTRPQPIHVEAVGYDIVDAIIAQELVDDASPELIAKVLDMTNNSQNSGAKIQAINHFREVTGSGFHEAKLAVEAIMAGNYKQAVPSKPEPARLVVAIVGDALVDVVRMERLP